MTVIWQTHRWKRLKAEFNLFRELVIVGGFFTIYVTKAQLLDKILRMLEEARKMKYD